MEFQDSAADVADKTITITADADGKPTAEDVTITKSTKITWALDDSVKQLWDLVSIEWKPDNAGDPGEFDGWEGSGKNSGKKIKSTDKCSKEAEFSYYIWVVRADGTGAPLRSCDPVIRNVPPRINL